MTADFSPAAPKPSSDRPIAAVQKALDVLDVLVFEDPNRCGLRLAELAARLNQKPATLRGILKTMIACGYVEQDAHARYRTGKRCEQIGALNRLRLRPNLLIGAINRGGRILTPGGRDTIEPGDTVVVVTAATGLDDLDDILDKRRVKA